MEALCLPEQLSSFHQRTLAQMGKPIIVELFGTMRRSMRATGRGDEGQAGNHDVHCEIRRDVLLPPVNLEFAFSSSRNATL